MTANRTNALKKLPGNSSHRGSFLAAFFAPSRLAVSRLLMSRLLVALLVVLLFWAPAARAGIITQPTSLGPGDTYRLAFVTSGTRTPDSTDIDDYNLFVTIAANAVPELLSLGTTWKAIGSTETVDARDNTNTLPTTAGGSLGVPIFLLNDTKLVDSNDDLWDGSIDFLLNRTELDTATAIVNTWTGTADDGVEAMGFTSFALGLGTVNVGNTTLADGSWVDAGAGLAFAAKPFYALSAELTVPFVDFTIDLTTTQPELDALTSLSGSFTVARYVRPAK